MRADSIERCRVLLGEALAEAPERVIAVGGDGTVNLVTNVLLRKAAAGLPLPRLGIVPLGTASDFARCLGLPRDPRAALKSALESAETQSLDVIEVEFDDGRHFFSLNIASAGLSGFVDQEVHRNFSGNYLWATVKALLAYEASSCRVEVEAEAFYDGPFFVLALANGRFFGKGMKVAPRAQVDDGLLDVVLVEPVPRWHLPWRLPQFLFGWHLKARPVRFRRATCVRLIPNDNFPPFDLDGEPHAAAPATFTLRPGALTLIT